MSSDNFTLHPQLAADTLFVGDLPLCRVLLMNNRHFPWLILVPRKNNLREVFDLLPEDYTLAMSEIRHVGESFARHTNAHKMNIAMLGNMVPQLHIHIIARFETDPAWPNPVWNSPVKPEPFEDRQAQQILSEICAVLNITKM